MSKKRPWISSNSSSEFRGKNTMRLALQRSTPTPDRALVYRRPTQRGGGMRIRLQYGVRTYGVHVASCSRLGAPKWTTHTPVCQTSQNSHRWRTRFELSPASNQISTRVVGTVDTTYTCARENVTPVQPAWQAGQHQHQNRHYGVHRFSILVGPLH